MHSQRLWNTGGLLIVVLFMSVALLQSQTPWERAKANPPTNCYALVLKYRKAGQVKRILKELLADGGKAKLIINGSAFNEAGDSGPVKRRVKLKRR